MIFKGVIFDFNGTLLWDTGLHNRAWDIFLDRYDLKLTDREKDLRIHGRNNELIFPDIFKKSLRSDEIELFKTEKESIYRELCREQGIGFAPGAVDFMKFLRNHQIAYAIATASEKDNVDFYLDFLKLGDLIETRNIIYNDGQIKSKPDPDIFLKAIKQIGCRSNEAVVFEDSYAGIEAAQAAGAGKVIIVDSTGKNYEQFNFEMVRSFDEVNRKIFI